MDDHACACGNRSRRRQRDMRRQSCAACAAVISIRRGWWFDEVQCAEWEPGLAICLHTPLRCDAPVWQRHATTARIAFCGRGSTAVSSELYVAGARRLLSSIPSAGRHSTKRQRFVVPFRRSIGLAVCLAIFAVWEADYWRGPEPRAAKVRRVAARLAAMALNAELLCDAFCTDAWW